MLVFMVHFLLLLKSPEFDIGCQAPCLMRGQNAATCATRQPRCRELLFCGLTLKVEMAGAGVPGAFQGAKGSPILPGRCRNRPPEVTS